MIQRLFFLISASVVFTSSFAPDWGQTGHRVIGLIAEQHLTQQTQVVVNELLEGESLAFVSTFGDEIRSIREYDYFKPWHYVNMPLDKRYGEEEPNPKGDVYHAVNYCMGVLQDDNASRGDKAFYLRLLVHFVGDLHQPMHVGRSEDRGGNDINVIWFGKKSNLHKVWDSEMIDGYQMSYSELANNLPIYTQEEQDSIIKSSIIHWMHESQDLAADIYENTNNNDKLSYPYQRKNFKIVREQLYKGGLRLAYILNTIL